MPGKMDRHTTHTITMFSLFCKISGHERGQPTEHPMSSRLTDLARLSSESFLDSKDSPKQQFPTRFQAFLRLKLGMRCGQPRHPERPT